MPRMSEAPQRGDVAVPYQKAAGSAIPCAIARAYPSIHCT